MIPEKLTIEGLRRLYRARTLTPEQVLEEICRRAARVREKNLYIVPPQPENWTARLAELRQMDPETHPLWGIPFTVKDNIDVQGFPTTAGCPAYSYQPQQSAGVVQRLLDAGAIPVGKANLDQFATGLVGTRSPYGPAHNALRDDLISGGSSSGSAVAVALGLSAFSLGTDTAGSGRVPAALNGLFGWKPSCGAWPVDGVVPACASIDCVTVFAHSMEDCLAVDGVARGYRAADPWSRAYPPVRSVLPKKLLLPQTPPTFFGPFADAYRAAWDAACKTVQHTGLPVETVDTAPLDEAAAVLYGGPWVAERYADLGDFMNDHPGAVFPATETVLRSGASPSAADLFRAIHRLQQIRRGTQEMLADAVLLLPTAGGTWHIRDVEADPIGTNTEMGRYTNHCNLLDLCACSLPMAPAAADLPFGITAFAPAGQEGRIAALAQKL